MKRMLTTIAVALMTTGSCIMLADQGPSAEHHPRKEDTYTITSVLQILQPVNPDDMNDDFQDVRVLEHDKDSCTVEVTYYPFYKPAIGENANWRKEDAEMTQYLKPTPTENWDAAMQRDLVAELGQAGIDPDLLTDKQLVEKVSAWAMKRAHSTEAFSIWDVYYPDGKPTVYPPLRDDFDKRKPEPAWTDQQMFDQEALGRSMFYNKVHGACTSSSVYLATIFRALGIPTRIIFCIPPFDPNDRAQYRMFKENIHHNGARDIILSALHNKGGFSNHLFNEVYVNHHWVRLNYKTLGQPILDEHYFGLLTHIYTCSDFSQVPLAQTWGMRYSKYPADQPKLSSSNPYRLISVQDHLGVNAVLDNPPLSELTTVTIIGLYRPDSPEVPPWAAKSLKNERHRNDFLIAAKEWLLAARMQMTDFWERAGHEFLLTSPRHAEVRAHLIDGRLSSGDGTFQAYMAQVEAEDQAKVVPGVDYSIQPINNSDTYRWVVAPDLTRLTIKVPISGTDDSVSGSTAMSGPNQALLEYLGNPVKPPPNMDPLYNQQNLLNAFKALGRKTGLVINTLAVDDLEFPFIVYGTLDGAQKLPEKSAFEEQKGYSYGGSVRGSSGGGSTYFAVNMVPGSQYPADTEKACQRRLMLRLQMLAAKAQLTQ
ncbi:MAG: transglutaminase domain-containing protein [Limisphaerales bacterium]